MAKSKQQAKDKQGANNSTAERSKKAVDLPDEATKQPKTVILDKTIVEEDIISDADELTVFCKHNRKQ